MTRAPAAHVEPCGAPRWAPRIARLEWAQMRANGVRRNAIGSPRTQNAVSSSGLSQSPFDPAER